MTYVSEVLSDSPAWYLRMNGNGNDSSGNGRNGTVNGSPASATGLLVGDADGAFTFDGSDDTIVVPYVTADKVDEFTYEFLIKTTQSGRNIYGRDLSGGSKYDWILIQSQKIVYNMYDFAGTNHQFTAGTKNVTDGVIHHVAVVVTGGLGAAEGSFAVYVDGVLDQTNTFPSTTANNTTMPDFYIGSRRNSSLYTGVIDEFAFYRSALSEERIQAHYLAATTSEAAVADFSFTTDLLEATFDASSSESGGTITDYSWDFGDSSAAGSGVNPSHTYAEEGTYTVTLTITDSNSDTDTISHDVFVSPHYFYDTFTRNVSGSWGSAEVGTWHGTSLTSVDGSRGRITFTAAGQGSTPDTEISASDIEVLFDLQLSAMPDASLFINPHLREGSDGDCYKVGFRISGDNSLQVRILKEVSGVDTAIADYSLAIGSVASSDVLHYKAQVFDSSPTTIRHKIWKEGDTEPAWQQSVTDSEATIQDAGSVSIETFLSGSATVFPTLYFDNFSIDPYVPGAAATIDIINVEVSHPGNRAIPVAIAGSDQINVEPYSTVTVSGTVQEGDGAITDYIWEVVSATNGVDLDSITFSGTGASQTFIAPGSVLGTVLTVGFHVIDEFGSESAQDTMTVTVFPVTETIGGEAMQLAIWADA